MFLHQFQINTMYLTPKNLKDTYLLLIWGRFHVRLIELRRFLGNRTQMLDMLAQVNPLLCNVDHFTQVLQKLVSHWRWILNQVEKFWKENDLELKFKYLPAEKYNFLFASNAGFGWVVSACITISA
jgi:hypothetical protein